MKSSQISYYSMIGVCKHEYNLHEVVVLRLLQRRMGSAIVNTEQRESLCIVQIQHQASQGPPQQGWKNQIKGYAHKISCYWASVLPYGMVKLPCYEESTSVHVVTINLLMSQILHNFIITNVLLYLF